METQKRSNVFGAALILFTLLLRLVAGTLPGYAIRPEQKPTLSLPGPAISAIVSPSLPTTPSIPPTVTMPPETTSPQAPPGYPFTQADVAYLHLRTASDCGYTPALSALLLQALDWQLQGDAPTVLIYHSHASESYTPTPGQTYTEQSHRHTTDTAYNMVAVGDALAQLLEEAGISVLHDRQIHDYPSYSSAYTNSHRSVQAYLDAYPSIQLVLDLHRDAAYHTDGSDWASYVCIDGQPAAQLMLVVGTDYLGDFHPQWPDNLSVALKLQVLLEKQVPGITRSTTLRGYRFNQELSRGALLIEVGSTGNTMEEIFRTLPVLADAIAALAQGSG